MTITIKGVKTKRYRVVADGRDLSSGFGSGCQVVIAKPAKRSISKSMLKVQAVHAHSAIAHAKFGFGV